MSCPARCRDRNLGGNSALGLLRRPGGTGSESAAREINLGPRLRGVRPLKSINKLQPPNCLSSLEEHLVRVQILLLKAVKSSVACSKPCLARGMQLVYYFAASAKVAKSVGVDPSARVRQFL